LRSFFYQHSVRRPDLIDRRIELVKSSRPLTSDRAVIEPAVMQTQMLLEILRVQQKHIARFDKRIAEAFSAHPAAAFFRELPGAGPTFAPRLLVAFGDDPARYPAASNLQMYAGVAPVQKKSGKQLWIHWRWLAPVFLRQTFVEWAAQTVIYCPWANAYYYRQKAAGKSRQAILRALAFKWIRILWKCWQTQEPYDDAKYIASLKRRGSPIIAALEAA
jgi:transposase